MNVLQISRCRQLFDLAAALVVVALAAGCSPKQAGNGKPGKSGGGGPVPVLATQAAEKAMSVELRAIGNVQAWSKVALRSRITGELTRVHFQEGQDVKQGDLLFTIDPRPSEVALRQTEANLARSQAETDNAQFEFDRQKKLFESALIARGDYDKAEANLKALQASVLADRAALSNTALNVEFTRIHSPIDGRTGNLLVNAGNIVQAGLDVLATVNQVRPIYVAFSVPEQHLAVIRKSMKAGRLSVEVKIPGAEAACPSGELTFVDNAVDTTTGTIQLKASFTNADNVLWPGQFVEVALRLKEQPKSVVVPTQAIQNGQKGDFVYVIKSDQTVELRNVKQGLTRNGETVVDEGLTPGETVVTDGHLRLVPGAKVTVKSGLEAAPAGTPTAKGS